MFRVSDAVRPIDPGYIPIIPEIIREAIRGRVRIKSHIRVVRKKKRPAGSPTHVQLDSKISFPIGVAWSRTRIVDIRTDQRTFLVRPTGVIQLWRNGVRGRS